MSRLRHEGEPLFEGVFVSDDARVGINWVTNRGGAATDSQVLAYVHAHGTDRLAALASAARERRKSLDRDRRSWQRETAGSGWLPPSDSCRLR